MAGDSRRALTFLIEKVQKLPLILNRKSGIINATNNTKYKVINLSNIVSEKFNTALKRMNNPTIIPNVDTTLLQLSPPLPTRLINYWQWYQKLIGLDKVEIAKQQVIIVQNNLFECQNQRRNCTQEISLINGKLKEIYSELIQTKRDNPKYVQLTIMENKSLQEHSKILEQLNILEKQEHDYFAQLATSIKEYHDCQTMNTQKYKYLSILASAFLGIVSLTASIIYNNKRVADLKDTINQGEKSIENILKTEFLKLFNNQKSTENLKVNMLNVDKPHNMEILDMKQISHLIVIGTVVYILCKIFNN
ncbi:PREDICTED: uncharacterized protein LOC105359792 [Ceratosolen solmsi marchali]|uniref:Uncharacterized protein LOC105359792 n=1 Tax=Ceratosolen solmsi marchali TaxID=326594 RepID=A0AAJ6VLX0_9HYME|nr:PREDICTED: uncharacterized protein LOC105359792 [Ceratosolen solmsi marchali]